MVTILIFHRLAALYFSPLADFAMRCVAAGVRSLLNLAPFAETVFLI